MTSFPFAPEHPVHYRQGYAIIVCEQREFVPLLRASFTSDRKALTWLAHPYSQCLGLTKDNVACCYVTPAGMNMQEWPIVNKWLKDRGINVTFLGRETVATLLKQHGSKAE